MPISVWSEKHRVLESSAIRGRWQNIYTPYLVDIMDAANMPGVEVVILCKSPQTGGSECGHNLVGYCIDRCPGPVMYVFPDEKTARENARDRIIPMITSSPKLKRYLTNNVDDVSNYHIKLMHMHIYLAWSGSVARLGNKPIRVLILDELDKYENPTNEARSEDLATKRTTTWRSRKKIFKISTPTTEDGPIWQAFTQEANVRFRYFVCCPDCGNYHQMVFENIGWPGKDTSEEPHAEDVYAKNLAYYVCPKCGSVWNDERRNLAVRAGEWRDEKTFLDVKTYVKQHKPKKVGFHVPAWLSYFVSLSEIAMAYLKFKQTKSLTEYKNFQNQYAAEPWIEQFEERSPEELALLCDDRQRGTLPTKLDGHSRVAALIGAIDTQIDYFRYIIRAIGYGKSGESWLIQEGRADSFDTLNQIMFHTEYISIDGDRQKVRAVVIDAMGEPRRAFAVYNWAKDNRGRVYPSQGVNRMTDGTWKITQLEYYPTIDNKKQKIVGGLPLFRFDVTYYKSLLASKLKLDATDLGAFHIHKNENDALYPYFREMTSEYWNPDEKGGIWVCPPRLPNHAWDCETMCCALADMLQINTWQQKIDEGVTRKVIQGNSISVGDRLSRFRMHR